MKVFSNTKQKIFFASWVSAHTEEPNSSSISQPQGLSPKQNSGILRPLRHWVEQIEVRDRIIAHRLCQIIPSQCPFERDIKFLGKKLFHIPPMCKLNPFYDEVVGLRFKALCYLADECGEDISQYC
jgi:Mo-dependent nitrogenase C-terminus